jgi:hypothetical protein
MTDYEQSPDYGGPDPIWPGVALLGLLAAIAGGAFMLALFG